MESHWIILLCLFSSLQIIGGQQGCVQSKVDLVFVVDSSGSIRDANPSDGSFDNYQLLKKFMTDIVDNVYAGPQWTRVGVVIFSQTAKNVFFLDSYSNKEEIKTAINGMEYLGSHTNTSGGISTMLRDQFISTKGDRSDARNVAIVITDGVSTVDVNQTIPSAEEARRNNIQIYSVGITNNIQISELKGISSRPQLLNENYFVSTNFTVLGDLVSKLGLGTCAATTPATTITTTTGSPCSNSVVDLVFVIDSSGSIRDNNPTDGSYDNYNLLLEFIVDIINQLSIGLSQSRVGLVLYSNNGRSVFHLNTYQTKSELASAVRAVEYIGGNTNTSGGLRVMLSESFTASNGDRPDVDNVVIVITDGVSTIDTFRTISDAKAAHDAGVKIYSVGITNNIKQSELRDISSFPHLLNQNYFMSLNFQTLGQVVNRLVQQTCSNASVAVPGSCISPESDVVFVVDSSGSICQNDVNAIQNGGCSNYKLLLGFVSDLVTSLSVNTNKTRIGLVLFANNAENIFYLDTYKNEKAIIDTINSLEYKGGNTNTSGALKRMTEEQFITNRGDRSRARNVAVVITDGESTVNASQTVPNAQRAHRAGINVYTVGIGRAVNVKELKDMSSAPQEMNRNYYITADFNTLSDLVQILVKGDCQQVGVLPTLEPTPKPRDMTIVYAMLLLAVFAFLVILRGLIFLFQRAADQDEEKQALTA